MDRNFKFAALDAHPHQLVATRRLHQSPLAALRIAPQRWQCFASDRLNHRHSLEPIELLVDPPHLLDDPVHDGGSTDRPERELDDGRNSNWGHGSVSFRYASYDCHSVYKP